MFCCCWNEKMEGGGFFINYVIKIIEVFNLMEKVRKDILGREKRIWKECEFFEVS